MISATVGRLERRNDSVLPAQSWNSSHTRVGFSAVSMAAAICAAKLRGRARAEAVAAQNPRNSRRDTPRAASSRDSHGVDRPIASPFLPKDEKVDSDAARALPTEPDK